MLRPAEMTESSEDELELESCGTEPGFTIRRRTPLEEKLDMTPTLYENCLFETSSPKPSWSSKSRNPVPSRCRSWQQMRMHEGYSLPFDEFRMAAMQGNLPVIRSLIKQGIAVDEILKSGWTCLMYACSCGKPQIVKFLLQQNADPNLHKELFTPLMAACASSHESEVDLLECVELLLNYGAKVNTSERHHMTALMFASKEGRSSIVQKLVEAKIDVNKQDNKGWTALCWAATKGHGKVIRTLLEHSADPTKMNNHGQRPVDIAFAAGHPEIADILERVSIGGMPWSVGLSTLCDLSERNSKHSSDVKTAQVFGELEMVLAGLDLSYLVPLFQEHQVSFKTFLRLSEKDLRNMNVTAIGVQKKILHAIKEINKKEWETSSLPNLVLDTNITIPEAVAMIANMNKHIQYMHASVGYIRDQLQGNPRLLQLGQEVYSVSALALRCGDTMKHIQGLHEELKFFKYHLDKINGNAEYSPADLIVDCTSNDSVWQRRLLATLVTTTAITTILWYSRPHISAWIFGCSLAQNTVTLDM
ncbi:ankyrin repeat, SAM and basic leucine zipper domain-containing protein 1-like isoform X2 [Panulirus ornatus]|uniref:ankyrin repeat, SAM and basic leucine zipper domain-containing protein 1-like isoform X2 n=1 Tax=Panulirus ornatus TaxID=150431 RepID=UPI003A8AD5A3